MTTAVKIGGEGALANIGSAARRGFCGGLRRQIAAPRTLQPFIIVCLIQSRLVLRDVAQSG
ncbi:MAG: hypothetical protein LBI57_04225 [Helicobacteraceae bacterium]|nr:hypothetical protein [Helicobacteraceae bacterium]